MFALGHDLADVVLLGAGTAVAEDYPGLRPDATTTARRERHGLSTVAPLALVTSGASLPADATSVTDVEVPSIVITCASAPEDRRRAWQDAGARVLLAGEDEVDLADARPAARRRGPAAHRLRGRARARRAACSPAASSTRSG